MSAKPILHRESIWHRGYRWICRLGNQPSGEHSYSVRECRIAAMAYEAGWKAAKRARGPKLKGIM